MLKAGNSVKLPKSQVPRLTLKTFAEGLSKSSLKPEYFGVKSFKPFVWSSTAEASIV